VRYLYALIVPGGVILLAAALFLRWAPPETVAPLLHIFPYVILGAGVLLAWRFHRTSVIFALLALALADQGLLQFVVVGIHRIVPLDPATFNPVTVEVVLQGVALLLPLNLVAFSLAGDRGSLASRFGFGFGVLAAQVLSVAILAVFAAPGALTLLEAKFLPEWISDWTAVADPGLVTSALAAVCLAGRCVFSRRALDNGFLWALAASFLAIHDHSLSLEFLKQLIREEPLVSVDTLHPHGDLYFSVAGLILVVAVIEAGYAMAFRDELTRLPGRRALNEALQQTGGQYAVAMVDVDHFKQFNDTYGHDVGDQVLKMVAGRLEEVTGGGRAFRYGGEEFSVLFAGKTVDEALPHLDLLRATIEDTRFALRGPGRPRKKPGKGRAGSGSAKTVAVTVSIGVAEPGERAATPEAVIKAADKALYRAKKGGRNQVRT